MSEGQLTVTYSVCANTAHNDDYMIDTRDVKVLLGSLYVRPCLELCTSYLHNVEFILWESSVLFQ